MGRRRIATALLAAYWLLTVVLAALHGGLDRHTYCPEHQTFEEQNAQIVGHKAVAAPSVDSASGARHDGCPFADCIHGRPGAPSAAPRATATVSAVRAVIPRSPTPPPPAVPILLTAPKGSPPRA